MEKDHCENCGACSFIYKDGYKICEFCGSKFKIKSSSISIESDTLELLKKCELDPRNARRYANLILDIDPMNVEALKYLL